MCFLCNRTSGGFLLPCGLALALAANIYHRHYQHNRKRQAGSCQL